MYKSKITYNYITQKSWTKQSKADYVLKVAIVKYHVNNGIKYG